MNYKLYYTVEGVIADLAQIICHTKNLSKEVIMFYVELQKMWDMSEFDTAMADSDRTPDELADDILDMYHDILHIYFEDMEKGVYE